MAVRGASGKGCRNDGVGVGDRTRLGAEVRIRGVRVVIADLDADGVRRFVVEDFPVVVVNDLHGGNLYRVGRE